MYRGMFINVIFMIDEKLTHSLLYKVTVNLQCISANNMAPSPTQSER